jgi:hypothetical protein
MILVVEMLKKIINERWEKKLSRWKKIGVCRISFVLICLFKTKQIVKF